MDQFGWCVRVDARDGYGERIQMLPRCTDYQSVVAMRHAGSRGENPHYHLVVRTTVKDQAFRKRMKKIFDQGKGNGHMSIKPWDGSNDAIAYLFHEDANAALFVQHGVTDETIREARERNAQVQIEVAKSKERASWKLEDEVYEIFKRDGPPNGKWSRGHYVSQDVQIAQTLVLTALRSGKYVPNDYLLKAMVRRIRFRLADGDTEEEEQYALSLAERICGDRT